MALELSYVVDKRRRAVVNNAWVAADGSDLFGHRQHLGLLDPQSSVDPNRNPRIKIKALSNSCLGLGGHGMNRIG